VAGTGLLDTRVAREARVADAAYRSLLLNLGLAAVYFGTGRLGLEIAGYAQSVTLVWPPAGIALAASASVGVASLELGGVLAGAEAAGAWLWWFVGDGVGILLVAPVLLTWISARPACLPARRPLEALALAALVAGAGSGVFLGLLPPADARYPLSFAAVPPLAWAASRFGPRGASLAVLATGAIAIAGTLAARGPFSDFPLQQQLLFLLLLVGVLGAMAFLLAAEVVERGRAVQSLVESKQARERGERELRQSEERFRLLADNASDILAEFDADGNVLYLSPSVSTLLGHSPEKSIAEGARTALQTLVHPDDLTELLTNLERVTTSKGAGTKLVYRARHASGEWRWLETLAQSFEAADGELHVVSVNRDVTECVRAEEEARRAQEQLLQTQKLESLGVLAGGIAHDFNNLLAVILGNVHHVLSGLPPDSALRGALCDVEGAVLRAAELVRQMLAYAGMAPFAARSVDLSALIEEMGALAAASLSKKARLRFRLAPGLPGVAGDPSQIRQLAMNLLTNASEALGAEEGSIVVETRLGEPDADEVVLEVRDSGCGMDEATRARMFDPFFTTKFPGRGLGLAAAVGIARLHRASIEVESEVGQGTLVRVRFPAAVPGEARAAPEPPEEWRPGGTIVVVDDEPALRSVARRVLVRAGFDVLSAAGGREALEVFRESAEAIRAVLLDLTMPGLSGAEVLSAMRALRPDVAVVAMSGYSEAEMAARFGAEAPDALLAKPFQARDLLSRLREVIEKPR
jgi:PAS domain S-box-containing protein